MSIVSNAEPQRKLPQTKLAVAAFFSATAIRVCDPILPRLTQQFQVTSSSAADVIVGFSIAYGLMQLVSGPLGDMCGKGRVVKVASILSSISALISAAAPTFPALICGRILWGMTAAGVIPLSMALIGDNVRLIDRQASLARLLLGTLSGMVAGQIIGGMFVDSALGWRAAFVILAIGYGFVGFLLGRDVENFAKPAAIVGDSRLTRTGLRFGTKSYRVLRDRWARVVLFTTAAEGLFLLGPLAYIPSYLHLHFDVALSTSSAFAALYAIGGLTYALVARPLVTRFGDRMMALSSAGLIAGGLFSLGSTQHLTLAGIAIFLIGLGGYLFHGTLQTHATQMLPMVRGTAMSFFSFSLFSGQAVGVVLAGTVAHHVGYGEMYGLAAGLMLLLPCSFVGLLSITKPGTA